MPRLTQIKETKKGRLALFLDGEFAFSLDEDTFAAAALHQDDELEDWQIEELRKKSETRRALDKAMDYLSLRDHAAGELYQKLCRKFDAHSAASAPWRRAGDDWGFKRCLVAAAAPRSCCASASPAARFERSFGQGH